jgi:hypothetical protein
VSNWHHGSFGHAGIPVRGTPGSPLHGVQKGKLICYVSGPHGKFAILDLGDNISPVIVRAKHLQFKPHGSRSWQSLERRIS